MECGLKKREGDRKGNLPEVFQCINCGMVIETTKYQFMGPCCGKGLVCCECYNEEEEEICCALCGQLTMPFRINTAFFKNIEDLYSYLT